MEKKTVFRRFLTYFYFKTVLQFRGAFIWKYIVALAELVHNKFAHCHEFLLKISPTSNDAFVSPCSHVHNWSVDHLRVKCCDFSSDVHFQLVQVAWPWGVNLNTECQFSIYFPVSQSWVPWTSRTPTKRSQEGIGRVSEGATLFRTEPSYWWRGHQTDCQGSAWFGQCNALSHHLGVGVQFTK